MAKFSLWRNDGKAYAEATFYKHVKQLRIYSQTFIKQLHIKRSPFKWSVAKVPKIMSPRNFN